MWCYTKLSFRGQKLLFSHHSTALLPLLPISLGAILLYQRQQWELVLLVLLQALQLLREFVGRGKKLKLALRNERLAEKREYQELKEELKGRRELMQALAIEDISALHSPLRAERGLVS